MHNKIFYLIIILIFSVSPLFGAQQSITVRVPKTAYIQWLTTPGETMSQASNTTTFFEFYGEEGEVVEDSIYLGIMCNSLDGYEIRFIAGETLSSHTALATGPEGKTIPYKVSLQKEASSFLGGSQVSTHLDMQGLSSSIRVQFQSGHSLPLKPYRPNVFKLRAEARLPQNQRGSFRGRITAIITLP